LAETFLNTLKPNSFYRQNFEQVGKITVISETGRKSPVEFTGIDQLRRKIISCIGSIAHHIFYQLRYSNLPTFRYENIVSKIDLLFLLKSLNVN
jgi:hypothetical protein